MDVAKAVAEVKAGKIDFKVDKTGIVHAIGKVSFGAEQIVDNAHEIIQTLILSQLLLKGVYQKYLPYEHYESCYCTRPKSSIIGS
jgi:large subunit ribosomal protein L1